MEEKQDKKYYSLFKNMLFCYKKLSEHMGNKYFVSLPFQIVNSVVVPLLFAVLPSIVIKILFSNLPVEQLLMFIVSYTLIICVVQYIMRRLEIYAMNTTFFFRINICKDFTAKAIAVSYENLESLEGKKKLEKAMAAVYSGNEVGIEAMINLAASLMISILGLTIYSLIVASLHPAIMVLLIICPTARLFVASRNRKWHEKMKEACTPIELKIRYLQRECLEISHGKDIRMYKIEKWFVTLFYELIGKRLKWYKKGVLRRWNVQFVDRLMTVVRDICCYGYLIYQVTQGMDIAQFTLYLGIIAGFSNWIQKLFDSYNDLLDNNLIINDYRTFIEQENYWEIGGRCQLPQGNSHTITLENISYTYPGSDTAVFENLNLTIKKGEKLALVGVNGSGKSTLIKLICGLYQPSKGRILLDGIDIRSFNLREYYSLYSVVFQEVFAFAFPLVDNITCGIDKDHKEEKLSQCIQLAGLEEKIADLPQGIYTPILKDLDDEGVNLSGGQMQKLMLARALYKEGSVIILDEPTAALDPIAEREMYEKYNELTRDRTSIFISHRLSSTAFCDRIIFMKEGKIVEDGTHDSLMAQKSEYANMYALQAHYYQEEVEVHVC